jgi:hypothetical protein
MPEHFSCRGEAMSVALLISDDGLITKRTVAMLVGMYFEVVVATQRKP